MVVTTRWKKVLDRSGRSQRSMASALRINVTEMNMVAQGRAFLSPEKLKLACELLDVRPQDVYEPPVLAFMYGWETQPTVKPPKRDMRVRLDDDVMDRVEFVANDEHLTRTQAANAIIRRAFETRRIEDE